MARASQRAPAMKPLTLGLVVAMGLFGIGCGDEPADDGAPPEAEVTRIASSLERKLTAPVAVPSDTAIGKTIASILEAHPTAIAREPALNLGANGRRCTIVRFDDKNGVEQMRREQCDKAGDTLRVGALLYTDENGDGKIDQFSDSGAMAYDVYDDDRDGKVDRVVEAAERITTPISLTDFGESVTITAGGKIASRAREDHDHDGKFDVESVTATTSFQIRTIASAAQ
jgi:hypothetical protein